LQSWLDDTYKTRMFPRYFRFVTQRSSRKVELFGNLVELMERRQRLAVATGGSLQSTLLEEEKDATLHAAAGQADLAAESAGTEVVVHSTEGAPGDCCGRAAFRLLGCCATADAPAGGERAAGWFGRRQRIEPVPDARAAGSGVYAAPRSGSTSAAEPASVARRPPRLARGQTRSL
jgi:hypothetical protein